MWWKEWGSDQSKHSILDVLISEYCSRLEKYIHLGLKKNYQSQTEPLSQVRGRICFSGADYPPRSLIHPTCEWEEWTEDTKLNRSILGLTQRLSKMPVSSALKDRLLVAGRRLGMGFLPSADATPILLEPSKNRHQVLGNLLRIAQPIVKKLTPSLSLGCKDQIALAFDMNQLFEAYVYSVIQRHQSALGIQKIEYQSGRRLLSKTIDFDEEEPTEVKLKNTFTDLILWTNDGRKIVLDAKYKLTSDTKSLGLKNADIYQITTYQRLHGDSNRECAGILLFPKASEDLVRFYRLNSMDEAWFGCVSIDLMKDLETTELQIIEPIRLAIEKSGRLAEKRPA